MNPEKLKQLKDKYSDRPYNEVERPEHQKAVRSLAERYSGLRTLLGAPFRQSADELDIALVGVPFDLGVTRRAGARLGPQGVREELTIMGPLNHATNVNPFELCRIADVGDVNLQVFSLNAGIKRIEEYYRHLVSKGVAPVSVGGDHSITYPILKALGETGPVGLIHIDAHCDTMGALEDSKFHHGGPFRQAVLDGVLDPERTIQIGIRGAAEPFWEFSYESGMTVVHIEDVDRLGIDAVIAMARDVVGDGPTYVSFDVDGLDASVAPGTGTPEIGGLTIREAMQLLRGLGGLNIIGGDVVEIAPEYDPTSCTVQIGKQLLFEILCLVAGSQAAKAGHITQSSSD